MSPTLILFLQSLLISLQFINAGLATITGLPVAVPLMVSAVVGGFQYFVQHAGNLAQPPSKTITQVVTESVSPASATKPAEAVQTIVTKTESL